MILLVYHIILFVSLSDSSCIWLETISIINFLLYTNKISSNSSISWHWLDVWMFYVRRSNNETLNWLPNIQTTDLTTFLICDNHIEYNTAIHSRVLFCVDICIYLWFLLWRLLVVAKALCVRNWKTTSFLLSLEYHSIGSR